MTYEEVLKLNARVTLQQMLQREDFKERVGKGTEVRLHELQYPIMQGWDSVELKADVEIGGTDQLFNMLVGRDLQKEEGQPQQSVICMPLLEGSDGVKKMSKSAHNYIGVNEEPSIMFSKLMNISDTLMSRYYLLLLGVVRDESGDPREDKKKLARSIVARYHGEEVGEAAYAAWGNPEAAAAGLPSFSPPNDDSNLAQVVQLVFSDCFNTQKSLGEIKKQLILPGAIQLDGEKLTDPSMVFSGKSGQTLRLSKKLSVRLS